MINTLPQSALPRHIDPRKFAQQGVVLSGQFAVSELLRLSPLLATDKGEMYADLSFGVDDQGVRYLSGQVSGQVSMVCQRCLEAAPQDLAVAIDLGLAWSDEDAQRLPKSWDPWIVGEGAVDLYQVLEDELILGLPIVAYHDYMCIPASHYSSGESELEPVVPEGEQANPFQVLAQLKDSLATPKND